MVQYATRRFHSHLTHRAQLAPSPILSVCSRLYFFQFPPFTMSNVCLLLSVFSLSLVDPLYVILDYSTGSISGGSPRPVFFFWRSVKERIICI